MGGAPGREGNTVGARGRVVSPLDGVRDSLERGDGQEGRVDTFSVGVEKLSAKAIGGGVRASVPNFRPVVPGDAGLVAGVKGGGIRGSLSLRAVVGWMGDE